MPYRIPCPPSPGDEPKLPPINNGPMYVLQRDLRAMYHLYWLGHSLLWAATVNPRRGLLDAIGHLDEVPHLAEQLDPLYGKQYRELLQELLSEAPIEADPYHEKFTENTRFLKKLTQVKHNLGGKLSPDIIFPEQRWALTGHGVDGKCGS